MGAITRGLLTIPRHATRYPTKININIKAKKITTWGRIPWAVCVKYAFWAAIASVVRVVNEKFPFEKKNNMGTSKSQEEILEYTGGDDRS
jgi:hypothetical protein